MVSEPGVSTRVLTVPNLISFTRLGLIPVFVWAFIGRRNLAALVLMFFIGISDFFDGWIARRFQQVSELGKLLDPVSDRIAIAAAMFAFGIRGTVPVVLVIAILARDAVVAIVFPVLSRKGYPRIPVNTVGKAATMSIFLGMGFALLSAVTSPVKDAASAASVGFLILGATLYWVAAGFYAIEIRRMVRAKARAPGFDVNATGRVREG